MDIKELSSLIFLVIAKIQIKWTYTKKATGTISFNLRKLQNTEVAENYMKQVNEIIINQTSTTSNQEEWNNIIIALKAPAEKNPGYNHIEKKVEIPKLCTFHRFRKISAENYTPLKMN